MCWKRVKVFNKQLKWISPLTVLNWNALWI